MPKFKIGDEVRSKNPEFKGSAIITDIKDGLYIYRSIDSGGKSYVENSWTIHQLEENCRKLTKLEKALK